MKQKNLIIMLAAITIVSLTAIETSTILNKYSTYSNELKKSYKSNSVKDISNNNIIEKEIKNDEENLSNDIKESLNDTTKVEENNYVEPNSISESSNDSNVNNQIEENIKPKIEEKRIQASQAQKSSVVTINYDRSTSIYSDDYQTLIRVEYYLNNKLAYYSDVENYDNATKSYTEKIYQWDYERDIEVLIRTDIYSNSILIRSY